MNEHGGNVLTKVGFKRQGMMTKGDGSTSGQQAQGNDLPISVMQQVATNASGLWCGGAKR